MSNASLMVCLHYQIPRQILGPRLMKWLKVANGISDRVSVQCENLYTILCKGPFTSSDCDDAARSLPNQLHRLCTVLLHTVFATATVTKLLVTGGSPCDRFKIDIAAILESRRSRCM